MPEAIDTAYVVIKPDTRGFAAETRRQVATSMRTVPTPMPAAPRTRGRDVMPSVGIRGPVIRGMLSAGAQLTAVTGGVVAATLAIRTGFDEIAEGQKVMAQTNAVIKSTGAVAGVSADHLADLASEQSKLSGIDDELIQKGGNLLLTFKNVRNVSEGQDAIFDRATRAAMDLSTAGFGSIESTSKQMGKALNDPIKGMTALGRAGVTFSQAQKDTIKRMVENNNVLGAQKLILREVESQVGGSAAAYGQTFPGAVSRLKNSFEELMAAGLTPLIPALTKGANAAAGFFTSLSEGGRAGNVLRQVFDVIGAAIKPVFEAIKSEVPRIKRMFGLWADAARNLLPIFKVVAVIVGVTLVAAFKLSIRVMEQMVNSFKVVTGVIRWMFNQVMSGIDLFLGGLASLADAASHLPVVGDQFKGVADAINGAREELRDFTDDLDSIDGKQVKVSVQTEYSSVDAHGRAIDGPPLAGVDAHDRAGTTGVEPPTSGLTTDRGGETGLRARREQSLINAVTLARETRQTLSDDRAALQALIAFYAESVRLAKARGVGTRVYQAQMLAAQNELADLNAGVTQAARDAADEAKRDAEDRAAAALEERRATLEANIRIAALSEAKISDDRKAYRALIAFLKKRVAVAREAGVGIKAAVAELKEAQRELRDLNREWRDSQLAEREELLQDNLTLASFTKRTSDDEKALRALIAFYRKRVLNAKKGSAERRKWKIELERTKKELRELLEEEKGQSGGADFRKLAFEFLGTQQGFFANVAGNLFDPGMLRGAVGGTGAAGPAGGRAQAMAEVSAPYRPKPTPESVVEAAEEERKTGMTQAQAATLIHLGRQTLKALQDLHRGAGHPELRKATARGGAAMDTQ